MQPSEDRVRPSVTTSPAGATLALCISLGAGIGLLFGTMLGSVILGMLGGAGVGVVLGTILEAQAPRRH